MLPVRTEACNFVYTGPEGSGIADLPVLRDGEERVTSWWVSTDHDGALLPEGSLVALTVYGEPIPPVALALVKTDGQPHTHEPPRARVLLPDGSQGPTVAELELAAAARKLAGRLDAVDVALRAFEEVLRGLAAGADVIPKAVLRNHVARLRAAVDGTDGQDAG